MKKKSVFLTALLVAASLTMSACNFGGISDNQSSDNPSNQINDVNQDIYRIYELYLAQGGNLSYDDWLKSIEGEKGFQEPEGDILREYYDIVEDILKENGFIHYEVSNWCKPGYQSKHNLTYWRNEQYYGCGLGASGYIGETRYKNTVNLSQYLKRAFVFEKEHVSEQDKSTYQIMLNLRTIEGLDISFVKNKEKEINELVSSGLLTIKDNHLIPTYEGMMVLDQIILKLL